MNDYDYNIFIHIHDLTSELPHRFSLCMAEPRGIANAMALVAAGACNRRCLVAAMRRPGSRTTRWIHETQDNLQMVYVNVHNGSIQ